MSWLQLVDAIGLPVCAEDVEPVEYDPELYVPTEYPLPEAEGPSAILYSMRASPPFMGTCDVAPARASSAMVNVSVVTAVVVYVPETVRLPTVAV